MTLPRIKHALHNIENVCQKRLTELYPQGIPEDIHSRYMKELIYLKDSDYVDDFEIFRLFSEETRKCSTSIFTRGTLAGSFIYFLLGNNSFNPLPAHYYCTECGYYEPIESHLFGIDLPQKKCPHCDADIMADGYNLSIESVWGNDGKTSLTFEHNVNSEFLPFAKRILEAAYPDNTIAPWGMFELDPCSGLPHPDNRVIGIGLSGYAILPSGNTIQDYPDLTSYLEDGDTCITGGSWELEEHMLKPVRLFSSDFLDKLVQLQRATGIYINELGTRELREITWSDIYNTACSSSYARMLFHEFKPKTFKDMVALEASTHNSHSWHRDECSINDIMKYKNMISEESFSKYPCFTREDFFDYMVEMGIDRDLAYDTSERIRKGHANSCHFQKQFLELPIPEEIKEIAKNYSYVFNRAHCIEYILIYAKFAYYAKVNSRAFSKIVFKKK